MDSTTSTTRMNRQPSPSQGRKAHTKRGLARTALCLAGLALTLLPLQAFAITLQPTELNPGDTYHLAFVGSSSDRFNSNNFTNTIGTYNTFVQDIANTASTTFSILIGAADGFTWKAIVSTPGVSTSAAANIGVLTSRIYNLNDLRVANNSAGLFGGSLINPINITPFGNVGPAAVWTGSTSAGNMNFPLSLAAAAGGVEVTFGDSTLTTAGWIDSGEAFTPNTFALYAISNKLTVPGGPAVIPEPTTFILFGTGLVGLFAWRMRKGRA